MIGPPLLKLSIRKFVQPDLAGAAGVPAAAGEAEAPLSVAETTGLGIAPGAPGAADIAGEVPGAPDTGGDMPGAPRAGDGITPGAAGDVTAPGAVGTPGDVATPGGGGTAGCAGVVPAAGGGGGGGGFCASA
ncbi:MAG TPA: hypothetical protein VIH43_00330 [Chthoniobacterales bacterium]